MTCETTISELRGRALNSQNFDTMTRRKDEPLDEYHARRTADEARRRADPEIGEQIKRQRREWYHRAGGRERQRAYYKQMQQERFFAWRARLWSSRWQVRVTEAQLVDLWASQQGLCALSGRALGSDAHLDHIHPVSGGGTHDITNIRWLDPQVNVALQASTDEDFATLCLDVVLTQAPVMEWIVGRIIQAMERAA